jgi:AmmeMemoRadiSam system protein B
MRTVRPAAVAGRFYPAEPFRLRETVRDYMAHAHRATLSPGERLRALIAPHAGYIYSGPVAGSAYRCLAEHMDGLRRVVLIGPAHYVPVNGLAASSAEAFATPLGDAPLDGETIGRFRHFPYIYTLDEAHRPEHSLEVQLPFLQMLGQRLEVAPLLHGEVEAEQIADLFAALDTPDTLFVISSDLSHFYDYPTAQRLDRKTADAIEQLQPLSHGQACGRLAINGLLVYAKRAGWRVSTLDLRNSGDTAGPRDRVVGYGAFAFTANDQPA